MKRIGFLFFLILFLSSCTDTPPTGRVLTAKNPEVFRKVLENGLTLLIQEVHRSPVVSIQAYVKTGSAHEGALSGSGVSHAVEHMFFKGTDTRGVGEVDRQIKSYGGDINAFTTFDLTGYSVVMNREHFEDALAVLADCLMHARFDEKEFEKEREVIIKEIRMDDDNPLRRISDLLWQNAFRAHPYRYPVIGYEPLLRSLTRDQIVQYYHERYTPDHTVIAIVGDIQKEKALESVEALFKPFERKFISPEPVYTEPAQMSPREIHETAPVQLARLSMAYHTVSISDKDMYPLDLLSVILGGGESSRLVTVLQKEKELVYDIDASDYTLKDPGLFFIGAALDEKKIPAALEAIRREIERVKEIPVPSEELKRAKQQIVSNFYFSHETVESIATDLAENESYTSDPLFSSRYVQEIQTVNASDLIRVAKKYLREDNLTIVTLSPPSQKKVAKGPVSVPPNPIEKIVLPNGVRILLKQDTMYPTVSISVVSLGGLLFEVPEKEGISNFFSRMLLKGTAGKTEKDIALWADEHGAALSPFSGQNSFGLHLKLLKEDTVEGILLLKELIRSPSFPEEEIEKEKRQILAELKDEEDQIFKMGGNLLRKSLYTRHPYRLNSLGSEATISRMGRNDFLEFYEKVFSPDRLVVSVFGDMNREEVLRELERAFSDFPERTKPLPPIPQDPPLEAPRDLTKILPKEQALLVVGFRGISVKDKDYYAFEVLTGILSGGGGKLHFKIRDQNGQAYTVGSYPVWGLEPGHYVFYAATSAKELPSVEEKLLAEIEALRHNSLPEDEMERSKEQAIGLREVSLQSADALSFQCTLDELYGLGYARYQDYEKAIRAVTAQDLQRIASFYFDPSKKVVIRILPKKEETKDGP